MNLNMNLFDDTDYKNNSNINVNNDVLLLPTHTHTHTHTRDALVKEKMTPIMNAFMLSGTEKLSYKVRPSLDNSIEVK